MSRPASSLAAALAPARARWAALAPREQTLVSGAAAVVLLAVLWWVAMAPALKTLQNAEAQRRTLDAQLQTMQSLQVQAQALQSQPGVNHSDALRALESSVKQGLGATAQLNVVGDRATVTLRGTSADALAQWLAQARVNARALPSEARLTRTAAAPVPAAAPGAAAAVSTAVADDAVPLWSGSLVLSLPPQ
ncbi:MAG: type II secretion system protein GspM [Polaromonas sp.]